MEPITPIQPEPIIQSPIVSEPEPKNNLFKVLFFVFLGLFLIALVVLVYFLNKTNQILQQNQITQEETNSIPTITSTPTSISTAIVTKQPTIKPTIIPTKTIEKNILKISDIEMDLPNGWKVISVSGNKAKVLTDYEAYQVYLTISLGKNFYESGQSVDFDCNLQPSRITTKYGQVCDTDSGATAWTFLLINNNKYEIIWETESEQKPSIQSGVWYPDKTARKIILDIVKTARPIASSSIN